MPFQLPLFQEKRILPTNKFHVSFSEVHTWNNCGWQHKLQYIEGLRDEGSEHTVYGGAIHNTLEEWLLSCHSVWFDWTDQIELCQKEILNSFEKVNFTPPESVLVKEWIQPVDGILRAVPPWMDQTFPGWKLIAAELPLFEPIEGQPGRYFKGFIDAVIKVPKPARKGSKKAAKGHLYWILDWKTTSWGWSADKKQDKYKRMQLALYKHYVSIKLGIPLEDIRCGFVLLKRTAKEHCELVEVSVGDKTRTDAVNLVSLSVNSIAKRFFLKNRNSCRFCPFQGTPKCP